MKDKKECIATRSVLWYLVFFGFAVNYMIRITLNIGIVSMIKAPSKTGESLGGECISVDQNSSMTNTSQIQNLSTDAVKAEEDLTGFEWNEYQQGLILGAFFWLHWTTQVPGGILANRYGTKLIFGLSNFSGVLFCFIIPTSAYLGYQYLILVRVLQGIVAGFSWPSMHAMTARWIPPNERSKFVTAYLGSSIGAGLSFPMCGYIIDIWGWEYVFYVSGILGTVWYICWYFLVYDYPSEHPRISDTEKEYILNSIGPTISKNSTPPVPWKPLLTSLSVWTNVFAQWGGLWGLFTLMTHAPTYFKTIHGWNITATGFLSGLPHLVRILFAYLFSMFGDYLLTSNKMSRTNVRKLATAICCIGQGFCMIGLAYSGCDYIMAIIFATSATGIHGAVSTGALASMVDLSPNYASILLGIGNGSGVFGGFISPIIVGLLTYKNQTTEQWKKVFLIAAGLLISSGTLFVAFSKSETQWWNTPLKQEDSALESEMEVLKKKSDEETKPSDCDEDKQENDKLQDINITCKS